eukprot:TRINITY_DN15008_c0_g1_i1.p1 TRINITY_DN15008_c0_g1~~TRINITY_DN15008_c0_g1_i1.p1  ORF type:complete len:709 (-),score=202.40 TRINITY_DN15008_c0_g1_i1:175-2301(-)
MSSFRDSFTKEDTKDDVLGYDDTAFHYFAISVLSLIVVPWTFSIAYSLLFPGFAQVEKQYPSRNASGQALRHPKTQAMVEKAQEAKRRARTPSTSSGIVWAIRLSIILSMWVGIVLTVWGLGEEKEIKQFDPFEILDVTPQSSNSAIKRAYRKLSLIYHPDKNPDDPLAMSRFIQITKAYQALTDEVAKRNWEKYGNPDGPTTTKVGIGLPRFLLQKENNLMILCVFFFLIVIVVPTTFICYYQNTKSYAANGVMIETLQFLGYYINENTRQKSCPELLAACAESRQMKSRPSDNAQMKKLWPLVHEHKKRTFTLPVVMKNQYLLWAHMQRHHESLTAELRSDVETLLGYSMRITQAMIEIACMREWFAAAQAMIDFRRCLTQALDLKSSQLLQVPHFNEELVQRCGAASPPVVTLMDFLKLTAERRRELLKTTISDSQKFADIDEFCAHVGEVELRAIAQVEDEAEIVVGDVATVTAQLRRRNLQGEECMGASHAPFFPEPKFEEWWFFLVEESESSKKATTQTRIIHFERVTDVERLIEQKLRFQVVKPGKNKLVLHALCDAYAGLDQQVDLTFEALKEEDGVRDYKVHEDDEALDAQPTIFQQLMGDLKRDEESEEEEDGNCCDGHSHASSPAKGPTANGTSKAAAGGEAQDAARSRGKTSDEPEASKPKGRRASRRKGRYDDSDEESADGGERSDSSRSSSDSE